jgi:hypothetical protein
MVPNVPSCRRSSEHLTFLVNNMRILVGWTIDCFLFLGGFSRLLWYERGMIRSGKGVGVGVSFFNLVPLWSRELIYNNRPTKSFFKISIIFIHFTYLIAWAEKTASFA